MGIYLPHIWATFEFAFMKAGFPMHGRTRVQCTHACMHVDRIKHACFPGRNALPLGGSCSIAIATTSRAGARRRLGVCATEPCCSPTVDSTRVTISAARSCSLSGDWNISAQSHTETHVSVSKRSSHDSRVGSLGCVQRWLASIAIMRHPPTLTLSQPSCGTVWPRRAV